MIENMKRFFLYQNYVNINTNLEGISVYYKEQDSQVVAIVLSDQKIENGLTKEQYVHILNQIQQVFYKKGYEQISILSLIATKQAQLAKEYCAEDEYTHWIIDLTTHQLIIYENQHGKFPEIKKQLDSILVGKLHTINTEYTQAKKATQERTDVYRRKSISRHQKPIWTIVLIVLNSLIFLAIEWSSSGEITSGHLLAWGANEYNKVVYDFEIYRLFTAMFLHASFEHLINNMFILLLIGERLERLLGGVKFLIVYLVSGLIASMGSLIYYHSQDMLVVGVGASGAIFGIVGGITYLVIRYGGRGLDITPVRLGLFVLISLYSGFRSAGEVDNAAHIVGFIAGILVTMLISSITNHHKKRWKRVYK